jgi:serine/threonine protein kinase
MPRLPPQLGPLKLVRQLGSGRHCQIWEAAEGPTGRRVAVKALVPEMAADPVQRKLLEHELKVGKSLGHPTVIRLERLSLEGGLPHLVMELFPHPDLKKQIAAPDDTLAPRLQRIVMETAIALDHVHSRGWVHRDVKPENLLVAPDGQVKLIDLAIATRAAGTLGRLLGGKTQPQGSPSYMAPEQIRGEPLDARADIYSFGCVLFELIAGRPPFQAANVNDLLNKHVSAPGPNVDAINPAASTSVVEFLQRLLAKQPSRRPGSMQQVLAQLRVVPLFTRG